MNHWTSFRACLQAGLLAAVLCLPLSCLQGCAKSRATTVAERSAEIEANVEAFRSLGIKGKIRLIWGDSSLLGWHWNASGTHGYIEADIDPNVLPPGN